MNVDNKDESAGNENDKTIDLLKQKIMQIEVINK